MCQHQPVPTNPGWTSSCVEGTQGTVDFEVFRIRFWGSPFLSLAQGTGYIYLRQLLKAKGWLPFRGPRIAGILIADVLDILVPML